MSLEYLMYNSFPQASAGLMRGSDEVDKNIFICVKNICINMYKRQLRKIKNLIELQKIESIAVLLLLSTINKLLYYILNCNKQAPGTMISINYCL